MGVRNAKLYPVKPLIVGAPRTGFTLLIYVASRILELRPLNLGPRQRMLRAFVQATGSCISKAARLASTEKKLARRGSIQPVSGATSIAITCKTPHMAPKSTMATRVIRILATGPARSHLRTQGWIDSSCFVLVKYQIIKVPLCLSHPLSTANYNLSYAPLAT